MSFNVASLPTYIQQDINTIVKKMTTAAMTSKYVGLMPGIKKQAQLFDLDTDVVFQTAGCTRTANGTTTFGGQTITVVPIEVSENLCPKSLLGKATEEVLKRGGIAEDTNFDEMLKQIFVDQKLTKIGFNIGSLLWKGDTTSVTPNLAFMDGWLKQIAAATDEINGNPTGITTATGITTSNIQSILWGIQNLIPDAVLTSGKKIYGYCGTDTFNKAIMAATTAFNVPLVNATQNGSIASDATAMSMQYPGTSFELVALPELTGTNRIITTYEGNLVYGFDGDAEPLLETGQRENIGGEGDVFEFYLDPADRRFWKFTAQFKVGATVRETNLVVDFKLV